MWKKSNINCLYFLNGKYNLWLKQQSLQGVLNCRLTHPYDPNRLSPPSWYVSFNFKNKLNYTVYPLVTREVLLASCPLERFISIRERGRQHQISSH